MTIDETFDVGVDTRTPVDDKDYQVPFRFTGKLDKLTFKLGPTQLTSEDHQVIQHALAPGRRIRRAVDPELAGILAKGCSGIGHAAVSPHGPQCALVGPLLVRFSDADRAELARL